MTPRRCCTPDFYIYYINDNGDYIVRVWARYKRMSGWGPIVDFRIIYRYLRGRTRPAGWPVVPKIAFRELWLRLNIHCQYLKFIIYVTYYTFSVLVILAMNIGTQALLASLFFRLPMPHLIAMCEYILEKRKFIYEDKSISF